MAGRYVKRLTILIAAIAALLFISFVPQALSPAWSGTGRAGDRLSAVELSCSERDLGTVPQGVILRPAFSVANVGTRRLILVEAGEDCCGQTSTPRQFVVAPGDSASITVEVDTGRYCGAMRHVVRYTTNAPDFPQITLTATGVVECPPEPARPVGTNVQ